MNSDDEVDVKLTKADIDEIPGKDLSPIIDVRPNTVQRGVLFKWGDRCVMAILDSNVDYTAADWMMKDGIILPEDTTPLRAVQALLSWATVCVFDPVEAHKILFAGYHGDETTTPTI